MKRFLLALALAFPGKQLSVALVPSLPVVNSRSSRSLLPRLNSISERAAATISPSTTAAASIIEGPKLPALPKGSTSKRIFWVRHGEVINPGGDRPVYYGALDVSLSPLGEQEATAAGTYLSQFGLSRVFCSPLKRAVYGAEQVLEQQQQQSTVSDGGNPVIILDGFKELDRGDWCGRTKDEIGADQMARFDACDESVTPKNGESYPELKVRVLEALDTVLDQLQDGESAAVVSHLQVTRCVLSEATGVPTNQMAGLKVATASVTCIDYENGKPQTVHFQSFKPEAGLEKAKDGAN